MVLHLHKPSHALAQKAFQAVSSCLGLVDGHLKQFRDLLEALHALPAVVPPASHLLERLGHEPRVLRAVGLRTSRKPLRRDGKRAESIDLHRFFIDFCRFSSISVVFHSISIDSRHSSTFRSPFLLGAPPAASLPSIHTPQRTGQRLCAVCSRLGHQAAATQRTRSSRGHMERLLGAKVRSTKRRTASRCLK